jgi:hypothetical protein
LSYAQLPDGPSNKGRLACPSGRLRSILAQASQEVKRTFARNNSETKILIKQQSVCQKEGKRQIFRTIEDSNSPKTFEVWDSSIEAQRNGHRKLFDACRVV